MKQDWPVRLFNKSVLKKRKYSELTRYLGDTAQRYCLDIGSDNGVISYLLRQNGGHWKSADLDERAVSAIRALVKDEVYQIDGGRTPFQDNEFDVVAIIDFLEHIPTDREFVGELSRIIKPGGEVIINVPHVKNTLLRRFRLAIGQTDEKHGHLRPGYTESDLRALLGGYFTVVSNHTYSKFFSECIDTLITLGLEVLKKGQPTSQKGVLVTGADLAQHRKVFLAYSFMYPVVWMLSRLDGLLFHASGYMLIAKARVNKEEAA